MAALVKTAYDGYRYIFNECADPRTKDWILVSGPVPLLTILIAYNYFCRSAGPRWMKDRKPFDLKYVLIVYNAAQVVFSAFLLKEALQCGWLRDYSYRCQPVDYSNNPLALRMARGCWWFLVSKVVELLDTVFFVLRKKNNQVSHLHLYHHTVAPTATWLVVTFAPGGHGTFVGLVNPFVHMIMYSYYLLAALGPTVQKYLWWKKYLTTLQIVQFVLIIIHGSQLLIYECNYPKYFILYIMVNTLYIMYMFGAFYKITYRSIKDA